MGLANQVHGLEIVKELYDLIFPRNEMVRDATYLGWGPEESVAYEDYLKQLSSLRRKPQIHSSPLGHLKTGSNPASSGKRQKA
jgi:hypothetical protein